jgi:hypothetical protein
MPKIAYWISLVCLVFVNGCAAPTTYWKREGAWRDIDKDKKQCAADNLVVYRAEPYMTCVDKYRGCYMVEASLYKDVDKVAVRACLIELGWHETDRDGKAISR